MPLLLNIFGRRLRDADAADADVFRLRCPYAASYAVCFRRYMPFRFD